MSIVRIGMSENKKYADGYAAIFGKKKAAAKKPAAVEKKAPAKKPAKKK
jgi:CDGSH-type Zn-finger protein